MSTSQICNSVALALAGLALFGLANSLLAASPTDHPDGYVIAKSRFGNGVIKARVQNSTIGWKVQLPGGRWVFCRRSCSETLRVETIDFFQSNAAGSGQITNECGIFGCLDLKYAR